MFRNRTEAGRLLAEKLKKYSHTNSIVLAVPRGGIPVAIEIAGALHLPIDVILAKKIGHPLNDEVAIGAVCEQGIIVDHDQKVDNGYIRKKIEEIREQIAVRAKLFRGHSATPDVRGKNVILVDDGIATGYTLLATIRMLRPLQPAKIIVAVPVTSMRSVHKITREGTELVCLEKAESFPGVGAFYEDFTQVTDSEAVELLQAARAS